MFLVWLCQHQFHKQPLKQSKIEQHFVYSSNYNRCNTAFKSATLHSCPKKLLYVDLVFLCRHFLWYSFFFFSPRTFTILCELFNKHPANVRGHRGAFNGFLSMPLLRLEACVSIIHCKSFVAGDKSGDQSEAFSSTQRWPRLLTATWKRLTACVSFQGVIKWDHWTLLNHSLILWRSCIQISHTEEKNPCTLILRNRICLLP